MGITFSQQLPKYTLTTRDPKLYDWIPDLKDKRDVLYKHPTIVKLKNSVCINIPFTKTQKFQGDSVSTCLTGIYNYEYNKNFDSDTDNIIFDSNFLTDIQSLIYNTESQQLLYSIRDALKLTNTIGSTNNNTGDNSLQLYKKAENYNSIQYRYINPNIKDIQCALMLDHPVIFGISMYESYHNFINQEDNNNLPEPRGRMLGGICCIVRGYDIHKGCFLVQGMNKSGFWIPLARLVEEGSCFWIISKTRVTELTDEYSFRDIQ